MRGPHTTLVVGVDDVCVLFSCIFQAFLWLSQIFESVVLMLLHVFLHLYLVTLALSLLRWRGFLLCVRLCPLVSLVEPLRVLGTVCIVLPCGSPWLLWVLSSSVGSFLHMVQNNQTSARHTQYATHLQGTSKIICVPCVGRPT